MLTKHFVKVTKHFLLGYRLTQFFVMSCDIHKILLQLNTVCNIVVLHVHVITFCSQHVC